jgi:uncharacterized NAD-dependent epimerase/dehydratase family protein
MTAWPEGNAIVYCQGAFNTPNGKTAHGLVRFTERFRVLCVVDSRYAGCDAGEVLDDQPTGLPIYASVPEAIARTNESGRAASHLVVGLAPDGGRLTPEARRDVAVALSAGINVDCGLHDFLTEDPELMRLATQHQVKIRDVRKPPDRRHLHFFTGKIENVGCLKVALLGTDSAVGKRTTAWKLVHGLRDAGRKAEMVGTGQTAWMQGAHYGLILDSLVNDFISGEIEHAVHSAWEEQHPDVIVIEGQGSLMNPAYPGGFEILAAGRPDIVVLQHAPARLEYDGFPGYPIHPLAKQIDVLQALSGKPVVAVTVNHEKMDQEAVPETCAQIKRESGIPAFDVLLGGTGGLVAVVESHLRRRKYGKDGLQQREAPKDDESAPA